MKVARLYLDANILILLGEGRDERATLLTQLAGAEADRRPVLCTSELTLAELLVRPYREKDQRLVIQYQDWMLPGGFLEIGPVDASVLRRAAMLRAEHKSLKLPDAIHAATAIGLGCSHLMSGDTRQPSRIEVPEDGMRFAENAVAVHLIRPDVHALRDMLEAGACT